jgi:addiction module HigA family antidote
MILSFADKETELIYHQRFSKKLPRNIQKRGLVGEKMAELIETPIIGEILKDEFLGPMNLSAYRLAKNINVPSSRILDILHNKRKISVETGLKLSRYFGLSDRFFIDLQTEIDVRNEKFSLNEELNKIEPARKAG